MSKKIQVNKKSKPKKSSNSISVEYVKMSKQFATQDTLIAQTDKMIRLGINNDYPYYLLELFRVSGLHRSIIERKVNMLVGSAMRLGELNLDTEMANPYETWREVFLKSAYDEEIFGGYYLRGVWNKGGDKIVETYHVPYEKVRASRPNKYGHISTYYIWKRLDEKIVGVDNLGKYEKVSAYNPNNNDGSFLLFTSNYNPSSPYYSGACYEGGLLDIQTYGEISNFHNSNLHNNFSAGYVIFFRGSEPTPTQKEDIRDTLTSKYSGSENTGKPMIFFLDEGQEAPVVRPMDSTGNADQFNSLSKSIVDNIVISHQIPKQVVGVASAGSLGQSKEILESSEMFRTDYIAPRQKVLLKGFQKLFDINNKGIIEIDNPNPNALMFGITELTKVLEINEVRKVIGFNKHEEGDVILGLDDNSSIKPFETDDKGTVISKKNDSNRKSKL